MLRGSTAFVALALIGCAGEISAGDDVDAGAADAAGQVDAPPPGDPLGSFVLTYYWVADEADYPGIADTEVFDADCLLLATVSADFFDALALEGTGRLLDDRVLNYEGACGCATSPCFFEVDAEHPWGSGSMDRPLVPFRSVAVDPLVVPIGARLWIAELDGVAMPGEPPWGGFVHDGCVAADDTGGAIDGAHLDFFAALREAYVDLDGRLALDTVEVTDGGARCP